MWFFPWVGSSGGLYESWDMGQTWTITRAEDTSLHAFVPPWYEDSLLLSSNTRRRLEISLDGGVTGLPFGRENLLGYTYAAVEDRVYIGTN